MVRIADLIADLIDDTAALLHAAFRNRSSDWQDLESARREVIESLDAGKISRVALDDSNDVVGWIGGEGVLRHRVKPGR